MSRIERVCLIHNFYQQPGGEDVVFSAEANLLERNGIEVTRFTLHNDAITRRSSATTAIKSVWNAKSRRDLLESLRKSGAQVAHFHNTFPLVSPAGYSAAVRLSIPVVQTLHNFRLICPNALLFRDGNSCEECIGRRIPFAAVRHACYRSSRAASAAVATMNSIHHVAGTWAKRVDAFIALTEFARTKFIAGGLPAERIFVKPNFVAPDPGVGHGRGNFALFVGRLSAEKGISVLADAWRMLEGRIRLNVAGDGPLAALLQGIPGVQWLGRVARDEVLQLMRDARMLIFPTLVYEGFPLVLAEAFAAGLPVLASAIGSAQSIVGGGAGELFEPRNAGALAESIGRLWGDEHRLMQMRIRAREQYEMNYMANGNLKTLLEIYERAARNRDSGASKRSRQMS